MLVAAARVTVWKSILVTICKTNGKLGVDQGGPNAIIGPNRGSTAEQGFCVVSLLSRIYNILAVTYKSPQAPSRKRTTSQANNICIEFVSTMIFSTQWYFCLPFAHPLHLRRPLRRNWLWYEIIRCFEWLRSSAQMASLTRVKRSDG